ncbi:MAG: P-II family nitrogen regulator [Lachnospiraceae bacterium]|nr:P-II family nitrogen regulator [Lachnospiraceae bacterium]
MKEIIALIRPTKVDDTKKALEAIELPAFTGRSVRGRGKAALNITNGILVVKTEMVTKRMMIIEAEDKYVNKIVQVIINVNSTGMPGDGRVFVVPVLSTYKVSEGMPVYK